MIQKLNKPVKALISREIFKAILKISEATKGAEITKSAHSVNRA